MHTYTGREVVGEALYNYARDNSCTSRSHVFVSDKDACNVALQEAVVRVARLHTSAYVSIRQHTQAYVRIRQHTQACMRIREHT